ncbi:MAG TPA: molybdopterin-dependent oxidoreductase [Dermatophilaceae bacterium]|nr:molybdopterin-dependent oxidoreductase [Dermatophilaceae bacterium]
MTASQQPTDQLPPGQHEVAQLRTKHYGKVPRIDLSRWSLNIGGDTLDGGATMLRWEDFTALPRAAVRADHHCAAGWSVTDLRWDGVAARTILDLAPPAPEVGHVLVSAVWGYSSSIRLADLACDDAIFATHLDGLPLTPEHGWPVRLVLPRLYGYKGPKWVQSLEYQQFPQRGFWEDRGYHLVGDAWREERYSYQE